MYCSSSELMQQKYLNISTFRISVLFEYKELNIVRASFYVIYSRYKLSKMVQQTWTFFLALESGYVLECRFTKFSEIAHVTAIMPFKVIQGHRFWYQFKAHIRYNSYILTYLLSCTVPSYGWLLVNFSLARWEVSASHYRCRWGWSSANITISDISLKIQSCFISVACIGVSSTTFT